MISQRAYSLCLPILPQVLKSDHVQSLSIKRSQKWQKCTDDKEYCIEGCGSISNFTDILLL